MAAQRGHSGRLWVVAVSVLGLYGGLAGRLYVIQAKDQPKYREMAASQHFVRVTRPERRGSILDCRGRALATSVQAPSIYVDPRQLDDPQGTCRRLAELLGLDATVLASRVERPMGLTCLRRGLSPEEEQRLRQEPAVRGLGTAVEFRQGGLYARPAEIVDPTAAAAALAPLLGCDAEELVPDLDGLRRFCWVKRKASEAEAKRVEAERLPGVAVWPEYKRMYPHGELACQLVGFTGIDEQGMEGLEATLDDVLAGEPGRASLQRDAAGRYISTTDAAKLPRPGSDVELTVDAVVQGHAEAALREMWDLWAPKGAMAVVLDPRTGDLLAAASLPTYDPNRYGTYAPADLKNRARARYIVDWFEPGSIMKALVFSGALQERVVTEQTDFFCENGCWFIGSRRFKDLHGYGHLSAEMVIVKSSNIGTAKIGMKLGPERLYRYLRAFGLGRATGFELPGENPGQLYPPSRWTSLSLPSVCIGHEVCVNGVQMALAYGAIANDGVLMAPRVVRRVRRDDGTWAERPVKPVRQVVPASVAQRVRRVLCRVVEEGTGKHARLAMYTLGGKTGTADKVVGGHYVSGASVCSFAAMAPAEKPQIVVLVSVDEPTKRAGGRFFGGTVAAPAVGQIIKQTLAYLGVAPDKPQALARLGIGTDTQRGTR
ncbi:MAG: penicillin-binding protein 2 [Planctomycetes bacterium]|nr:penicillin-binding protein 2 [Planctomycetota bacterium]